uniref:Methylmalonyl-CoA mutase C-terminal domain-containing protein n=1 Tax=Candidatus Kentrum sp. UNK TaxID=2126344 RepID=A0A451ATA7_9GAMM|nr:MAG: methylmalonyl-CoA mutase C-terminal domain-containing protein [Candidatus Kentron sp. UNK]VFK69266.1 MAG: methylmalonyl-CoA mutase C-terminal domain-containing protein [Candidatus Kentron sp. UNK]
MVVVGAMIPAQDYDFLYRNGASTIFGPGRCSRGGPKGDRGVGEEAWVGNVR